MPTISIFFGFVVQMYWRDHPPPHVQVFYQGFEALIAIETGEMVGGALPPASPRSCSNMGRAAPRRVARELGAWEAASAVRARSRSGRRMIEIMKVAESRPLQKHRLWVRFSNGREGVRDFADILAEGGPVVEPLNDPAVFARAFLSFGAPSWPHGYDIDPTALYREMDEMGLLSPLAA